MTVVELQHALAVEPGATELDEDNITDQESLTSVCAGLVVVDERSQIIRLVHHITQDYFRNHGPSLFPNAHKMIVETCIKYLIFDVFQKEVPLDRTELHLWNFQEDVDDPSPVPFLC